MCKNHFPDLVKTVGAKTGKVTVYCAVKCNQNGLIKWQSLK